MGLREGEMILEGKWEDLRGKMGNEKSLFFSFYVQYYTSMLVAEHHD